MISRFEAGDRVDKYPVIVMGLEVPGKQGLVNDIYDPTAEMINGGCVYKARHGDYIVQYTTKGKWKVTALSLKGKKGGWAKLAAPDPSRPIERATGMWKSMESKVDIAGMKVLSTARDAVVKIEGDRSSATVQVNTELVTSKCKLLEDLFDGSGASEVSLKLTANGISNGALALGQLLEHLHSSTKPDRVWNSSLAKVSAFSMIDDFVLFFKQVAKETLEKLVAPPVHLREHPPIRPFSSPSHADAALFWQIVDTVLTHDGLKTKGFLGCPDDLIKLLKEGKPYHLWHSREALLRHLDMEQFCNLLLDAKC